LAGTAGTEVFNPAPENILQLSAVSRRANRVGNDDDAKLIEAPSERERQLGNAVTVNRFIIAGALLALLSISALVNGVRKGRVYLRGPHGRVDRRRQPIRFWTSIIASGVAALIGLAMIAWGILQRLV
jgi:hypothetical protein